MGNNRNDGRNNDVKIRNNGCNNDVTMSNNESNNEVKMCHNELLDPECCFASTVPSTDWHHSKARGFVSGLLLQIAASRQECQTTQHRCSPPHPQEADQLVGAAWWALRDGGGVMGAA